MTEMNAHGLLAAVAIELNQWTEYFGLTFCAREGDRAAAEQAAAHWSTMNLARYRLRTVTWDGLLCQAMFEALGERDPVTRRQKLVELATTALAATYARD